MISGDILYVGSDDGYLYALDTESGDEIWSYEVGEDLRSSPAIAGGLLLIATGEGKVLAFRSAGE